MVMETQEKQDGNIDPSQVVRQSKTGESRVRLLLSNVISILRLLIL